MCLLIPPKKSKKTPKAKDQPKSVAFPTMPRYSRAPTRSCCAPASSAPHQADDFIDFLYQNYPDDRATLEKYSTQLGIHRLDDTVHAHSQQNQKATEGVGQGVKDIQERLGRIAETLRGTDEAAKAAAAFGENEKKRQAGKADDKRRMKEEQAHKEVESLRERIEKGGKEEKSRGIDEAGVLKLLEERDMRRELERLQSLSVQREGEKSECFLKESQLWDILDQREQLRELERLQAMHDDGQKHGREYLAEADLLKILDQRDRERDFARLKALHCDKAQAIKQETGLSHEDQFRKVLEESEQRREFERLKALEADVLKRETKPASNMGASAFPSLPDIGQLIEDILERHDRRQHYETGRESLSRDRRRQSPSGSKTEAFQSAIDQILELLLQRQPVDKAVNLLETLLERAEDVGRKPSRRESDRQWILSEVLRYLDTFMLERQRDQGRHKPQRRNRSDDTCWHGCAMASTFEHRPRVHACPPPYHSPRSGYPDVGAARRWASDRAGPAPSHWDAAAHSQHY